MYKNWLSKSTTHRIGDPGYPFRYMRYEMREISGLLTGSMPFYLL